VSLCLPSCILIGNKATDSSHRNVGSELLDLKRTKNQEPRTKNSFPNSNMANSTNAFSPRQMAQNPSSSGGSSVLRQMAPEVRLPCHYQCWKQRTETLPACTQSEKRPSTDGRLSRSPAGMMLGSAAKRKKAAFSKQISLNRRQGGSFTMNPNSSPSGYRPSFLPNETPLLPLCSCATDSIRDSRSGKESSRHDE